MADKKPLLVFPIPSVAGREKRPPKLSGIHLPSHERQIERIGKRWKPLTDEFENYAHDLSLNPEGFFTEYIVVFEIAGTIEEFYKAIQRIPGMFFLKELQEIFDADGDFYKTGSQTYTGRIFVSLINKQSIVKLLTLWNIYIKNKDVVFESGLAKFKDLFDCLKEIRPYSVEDRFKDTGMPHYLDEVRGMGQERVRFEIEFAYPEGQERRNRALEEVQNLITEEGGEIVSGSILDLRSIRYLACLADAPISVFENLTSSTTIKFLKASHVLFFRPMGQALTKGGNNDSIPISFPISGAESFGDPMVAVFDGLPLENHELLRGKVVIDDPDGYSSKYIAGSRIHGTAVVSTVCYSDLNGSRESLERPVYIRPVMHYHPLFEREVFPDDKLVIDVLHQAIIRMVKGSKEAIAASPRVKVVNLSLGDNFRPFNRELSTWARFLDWAAYEYNLLFIVSAGNYGEEFDLHISESEFVNPISSESSQAFLKAMFAQDFNRKVLAPAESVNALTVGSLNLDGAEIDLTDPLYIARIKLTDDHGYLAPYTRFGWGHNGAVKPDILMPGGRALLRKKPGNRNRDSVTVKFEEVGSSNPPGILVAAPGVKGDNNHVAYQIGTTFSAAQTTHLAGKLIEILLRLNQEAGAEQNIEEEYFPVLIKALIAHGANLGGQYALLRDLIKEVFSIHPTQVKARTSAFVGYGGVDAQRVLFCTAHRVTLIGVGELCCEDKQNAHLFRFPLPPSISSQVITKTLVTTLAWFSPCNVWSNKYRKAHLYLSNLRNNDDLSMEDGAYDFTKTSRGTLQHQILTGNRADVFMEGGYLTIKVNCRKDASGLESWEKIRYGLAVTLEIPETVDVNIYEEIKAAIQTQIRPRQ
jgi:hypothetical protein